MSRHIFFFPQEFVWVKLDSISKPFSSIFLLSFVFPLLFLLLLCRHCNIGSGGETLLSRQIKFKKKTFVFATCTFHLVFNVEQIYCVHDLHSTPFQFIQRLFPKSLFFYTIPEKKNNHVNKIIGTVWERNLDPNISITIYPHYISIIKC